jgi:cell division transport system permease protein
MLLERSDLPLSDDPAVRILPWVVGLMVYLATLTLAVALLVSALAADWSAGLTGTVTIHIVAAGEETEAVMDGRVAQAIRIALKTPGIDSARAMPSSQVAKLLAPWLGDEARITDLPLPRIVDVKLANDAAPDIAALRKRLEAAVPGAGLDDHQLWRDRLVKFLFAIEIVAGVMVTLIGATTVTVVVFATRAGLAVHNEVIEVLHLIGARDEYVARQFQSNALKLGLKGGIAGSAAGLLTVLAIRYIAANLDIELFPTLLFQIWHWPVLVSVPAAAAFIVRFSARHTVLKALRRMP